MVRIDPLNDWKEIVSTRAENAQQTVNNYANDIDRFIYKYESRQQEDLLQSELNYITKLKKSNSITPSTFKSQLESLNNKIELIPGTQPEDILQEPRIKAVYLDAMPTSYRKRFREIGKTLRNGTIESMSQYFDILYNDESRTNREYNSDKENQQPRRSNNNNNNYNNNSTKRSRPKGKPNPNDPYPIHHTHKWKDCVDNRHGHNYMHRGGNSNFNNQKSRNDQHNNSENISSNNNEIILHENQDDNSRDENPYEESIPQYTIRFIFSIIH